MNKLRMGFNAKLFGPFIIKIPVDIFHVTRFLINFPTSNVFVHMVDSASSWTMMKKNVQENAHRVRRVSPTSATSHVAFK